MNALEGCLLYGILDLGYVAPANIEQVAEQMCAGGVDLLQLRAKDYSPAEIEAFGARIAPVTSSAGVPLIINDFPELVPAIGAQGAHVGQDDRTVDDARWRAGRSIAGQLPRPLIGKSTHSIAQAMAAEKEGAEYIGFGPLFSTPTKPKRPPIGLEEIQRVHELVQIPVFCIGGVNLETLEAVLTAGARRVVVVSGILQAPDIESYCRELKAALQRRGGGRGFPTLSMKSS